MAVIDRVSSDSVLMPYRGWGYPDTSGVSAAERLLITYMYAGISAAALASLQLATSVTPTVEIYFYSVSWSRLDNANSVQRLIKYERTQEPYNCTATIYLDNSDGYFDNHSLYNLWIRIDRGISGYTNQTHAPYLKVIDQEWLSSPDDPKDVFVIHAEGAFNILQRLIMYNIDNPFGWYYYNQTDYDATRTNMTGKAIIDEIVEMAGLDIGTDISLDTYIANTDWYPKFDIPPGSTGLEAVLTVLSIYKSMLLARTDELHIVTTNTDNSYTYKLPQDASCQSFTNGSKSVRSYKAMKVVVNDSTGTYQGSSQDDNWASAMGYYVYDDISGVADSDADCTYIAEAIRARLSGNTTQGIVTLPIMNCLQELYDAVTITDGRGNIGTTGVVGGIYEHYHPFDEDTYEHSNFWMQVRIGGLYSSTPDNVQDIVDQIGTTIGINGSNIKKDTLSIDYVKDGRNYSKTLATDIEDGHIKLTSDTVIDGKWYSESGVEIDADTGIDVYGTDMAFTTSKLVGTSITSVASSDSGTTITCTTAAAHGLTTGDQVILRGMSVAAYDGKYTCTVIDADEFKVTVAYSATATGYVYQIQCSVDSDGAITAGAGAVIIDNNGIIIDDANDSNNWLVFKDGEDVEAYLQVPTAGGFKIKSNTTLTLDATNFVDIDAGATGVDITSTGGTVDLTGQGINLGSTAEIDLTTTANVDINAGTNITLDATNDIIMASIPDADPHVAGALYYNSGTGVVYISAG